FAADVADQLGNQAHLTAFADAQIHRQAPDASTAIDPTAVTYLRVPYGAAQTSGAIGSFLVPASLTRSQSPASLPVPAALFPGTGLLAARFWSAATNGIFLGDSTPQGSDWSSLDLEDTNTTGLWVSVVDAAGNESTRRSLPVEWVATLAPVLA